MFQLPCGQSNAQKYHDTLSIPNRWMESSKRFWDGQYSQCGLWGEDVISRWRLPISMCLSLQMERAFGTLESLMDCQINRMLPLNTTRSVFRQLILGMKSIAFIIVGCICNLRLFRVSGHT